MAYQQKPGQGTLFSNDYKKSDNHPDWKGTAVAHRDIKAGETIELAGWIKSGAKGDYISVKLSDPRERPVADNTRMGGGGETPQGPHGLDDSIPFITPWGHR